METKNSLKNIDNNNIKQLTTKENEKFFRYKIGDYRIGFSIEVDDDGEFISFEIIKTRGEIYKHFPPSNKKRKK